MAAAGLGDALFAEVDPNPNEINLAAGVAAYQAGGYDGVIAFGGGSGLDLGKMVAFMAGQTRPVWDFEDIGDWWTRADADAIAPIIAVLNHLVMRSDDVPAQLRPSPIMTAWSGIGIATLTLTSIAYLYVRFGANA